jgi:DinB superfamily
MELQNQPLSKLLSHASTIAEETQTTFGSLTSAQLNWKPAQDRWSVGQCFDHLLTTNKEYLPIFENVLNGTKKTTMWERVPIMPKLWGTVLIKSLDPKSTRKVKAPRIFQPSQSDVSETIIADFVHQQEKVIEHIKATEHLDLNKIIVTSPVAAPITYSLMDAYKIIVIHEQRHFQQARRVTEESGFPV